MAKTYFTITVDSDWIYDELEFLDNPLSHEEIKEIVTRVDEYANEFYYYANLHYTRLIDDIYDTLHSILKDFVKEKAGDLLDERF